MRRRKAYNASFDSYGYPHEENVDLYEDLEDSSDIYASEMMLDVDEEAREYVGPFWINEKNEKYEQNYTRRNLGVPAGENGSEQRKRYNEAWKDKVWGPGWEKKRKKKARFEEGVPADPTVNMSPEDAEEWRENTQKYKDQFKTAAYYNQRIAQLTRGSQYDAEEKMAGRTASHLRVKPNAKEIARGEVVGDIHYTTVTRPQADGSIMVAIVLIPHGDVVMEQYVYGASEVGPAIRSMLREWNKLGFPSQMANRSRKRPSEKQEQFQRIAQLTRGSQYDAEEKMAGRTASSYNGVELLNDILGPNVYKDLRVKATRAGDGTLQLFREIIVEMTDVLDLSINQQAALRKLKNLSLAPSDDFYDQLVKIADLLGIRMNSTRWASHKSSKDWVYRHPVFIKYISNDSKWSEYPTPDDVNVSAWISKFRTPMAHYYSVLVFTPRSKKPLEVYNVNYKYAKAFIEEQIKNYRKKEEIARKRNDDIKQQKNALQPEKGDILASSWGYDQTNVNFYQVVQILGPAMIAVRRIMSDIVSRGHGINHVVPRPNAFIGSPMRKKIQPEGSGAKEYSIKINSYETAYMWDGKPMSETAAGYGR